MCQEINGLQNECYEHVIKAAKTMLQAEERYIDKMFEQGDIENLKVLRSQTVYYENVLMKKLLSSVTATNGSTLNLTKSQRAILTGSTILPGGTLILIFLLLGLLITRKLTKVKILKIFGR